jgi:hypothetical protein
MLEEGSGEAAVIRGYQAWRQDEPPLPRLPDEAERYLKPRPCGELAYEDGRGESHLEL